MKKLLAIFISVLMIMMAFAACSAPETDDPGNETESTPSATVITTDEAVLKNNTAVNYIKLYTAEELGLSQEDYDGCSFVVHGTGVQIENDYYVNVAAVYKIKNTDEEGNETYTFDAKGDYYIRYDGKRVLKKDLTSQEPKYDDLEVKEIPEDLTEIPTAAPSEEATEAASE